MLRRTWLAAALGATLTFSTVAPGAALAAPALQASQDERFTLRGTIIDLLPDDRAEFRTSGLTGEPTIITLDLSTIAEAGLGYADIAPHTAIAALVEPLGDGTYRMIQYQGLAKGSQVNSTDWGVEEEYTTRDGSINARTNNGPDDDEARAQGTDDDEDE